MSLANALNLDERELVSFVGAGGKKTAMNRLIETALKRDLAAVYTTTTHMPPPETIPVQLAEPADLPAVVDNGTDSLAVAHRSVDDPDRVDGKVRGFDPTAVSSLFTDASVDWVLVKADGARMREFKAPGPNEPQLPAASTLVVPVASAKAIGRSLDATNVHRVERVTALTGLSAGDRLTPETIGRVLAHPRGGRKAVPDSASVVPLVNKADTATERQHARVAVETALDLTDRFDRGLVTSFTRDVIDVVR